MELRNIETFLNVIKYKSFSNTAQNLGYAQSTITMQIQQLESELNAKLFDRIGKSIYLTSFGEDFALLAREMYNLSLQMKYLNNDSKNIKGTLRIGSVESFLYSEINTVLIEFVKNYPNVKIDIRTGSSTELYYELEKNNLDIVFGIIDPKSKKNFKTIFSEPINLIFITNSSFKNKIKTLKDIEDQLFVLTEKESYYNEKLTNFLNDNNLNINKQINIQNISSILDFIKSYNAISFLPEYVAEKYIEDNSLSILDINKHEIRVNISASIIENKWRSPYFNYFISLLKI